MTKTRFEYIAEQQAELSAEGLKPYEIKEINFDDEYYTIIENHIKQGGSITNEIYNSLTDGQKYHFNKHYNYRGDKVINSDYSQAIEEVKKQTDQDFNKYLLEQKEKQQEQQIRDRKAKEHAKKELLQKLKQLKNNLFDYNKLSPIGKRNIKESDHNSRQEKIKNRITEIKNDIKLLA